MKELYLPISTIQLDGLRCDACLFENVFWWNNMTFYMKNKSLASVKWVDKKTPALAAM